MQHIFDNQAMYSDFKEKNTHLYNIRVDDYFSRNIPNIVFSWSLEMPWDGC